MFKSVINFFKGIVGTKEVQALQTPTIDKDKVAHVTQVMEAPYKIEAPAKVVKAPKAPAKKATKKPAVKKRAPRKPKTEV